MHYLLLYKVFYLVCIFMLLKHSFYNISLSDTLLTFHLLHCFYKIFVLNALSTSLAFLR